MYHLFHDLKKKKGTFRYETMIINNTGKVAILIPFNFLSSQDV